MKHIGVLDNYREMCGKGWYGIMESPNYLALIRHYKLYEDKDASKIEEEYGKFKVEYLEATGLEMPDDFIKSKAEWEEDE